MTIDFLADVLPVALPLLSVFYFLFLGILQIVSFVRTGRFDNKISKKMEDFMISRNDVVVPEPQTFSNEKKVLKYDKRSGQLYASGEVIDLQALMNSHKSSCFDSTLESYLPAAAPEPEFAFNGKHYKANDFLDDCNALADCRDDLVEKYSLPSDISLSQLADFLNEASFAAEQAVQKNKKEVIKDGESETSQTVQTVQPEAVPQDGKSSSQT
ncbi:hypothetical protein [Dipodfec virus UOA04_Rod_1027]|nr:hypothetical protein [Dipodfec virus UOA04_Rod_1027]